MPSTAVPTRSRSLSALTSRANVDLISALSSASRTRVRTRTSTGASMFGHVDMCQRSEADLGQTSRIRPASRQYATARVFGCPTSEGGRIVETGEPFRPASAHSAPLAAREARDKATGAVPKHEDPSSDVEVHGVVGCQQVPQHLGVLDVHHHDLFP